MALKLYPDSRTLLEYVLVSDPSIQEANTEEALVAYVESGDLSPLAVPDDATRVVIHPLTSSGMAVVQREAGERPSAASARLQLWGRAVEALGADATQEQVEAAKVEAGYTWDDEVALDTWVAKKDLVLCSLGIESISDFPGVKPVNQSGARRYPIDLIERMTMAARVEIASRVQKASALTSEGKA